jgi:hypothetical protein
LFCHSENDVSFDGQNGGRRSSGNASRASVCQSATECEQESKCGKTHRQSVRDSSSVQGLEFFWQLPISQLICIKVHNGDAHPMLHFAGAKVVQDGARLFVFCEILGGILGSARRPHNISVTGYMPLWQENRRFTESELSTLWRMTYISNAVF